MSIREAVAELADVIAANRGPFTANEQRIFDALRQLPNVPDVGWWDQRYSHVASQPSADSQAPSSARALMDRVWWFGGCQLYGTFDPEQSMRAYLQVIDEFNEHLGLSLEPTQDVSHY